MDIVLVSVLTKGHARAILLIQCTKHQELEKNTKWNQQGVNPVV